MSELTRPDLKMSHTNDYSKPDDTLIEGFDFQKRKEVEAKLKKVLEEIRNENLHLKIQHSGELEDVSTMYLTAKMEEVEDLREEINAYNNEGLNFTKQHRTLQGHCGKLKDDLNDIDDSGRDNLGVTRKRALNLIDQMGNDLAKKVHHDRKVCPQCEIKN